MGQKAWQMDYNRIYRGVMVECQPNPRQTGDWMVPGWCVTVEPPMIPEGKIVQWDVKGKKWVLKDKSADPELKA